MASAMFQATYDAQEAITKIMTIAWGLNAGLWMLYQEASNFFSKDETLTSNDFLQQFFQGTHITRLNSKEIIKEGWPVNERYISEMLLINAFAIFDGWVDDIIDAGLSSVIPISEVYDNFIDIKKKVERGEFKVLEKAVELSGESTLKDAFDTSKVKQDNYIKNLIAVFMYFKACRNCIAHGDKTADRKTIDYYNKIKNFQNTDIGVKVYPAIIAPQKNTPLEIKFRGVVGFYDILRKIIMHYDSFMTDYKGAEIELIARFKKINSKSKLLSNFSGPKQKLINSLKLTIETNHIYTIQAGKEMDVYKFLKSNLT